MPPRLVSNCLLGEDLFPMVRAPGRHVSTAIRAMMAKHHPDRFTDSAPSPVRLNLGSAFEHALVEALAALYPDRYHRIGEVAYDGLTGTSDLLDVGLSDPSNPSTWGIAEIKLTWAGGRRAEDIEDPWFYHYWCQVKAYVKMAQEYLRLPGLRRGNLIVCFINGGGQGPYGSSGPEAHEWEWLFTQEELDDNWAMIKAYSA